MPHKTTANLVGCELDRTILLQVGWTANNTVTPNSHCLVNLRSLVRREVVMKQCPALSRIIDCIVRISSKELYA
jgi:hypothetical protein